MLAISEPKGRTRRKGAQLRNTPVPITPSSRSTACLVSTPVERATAWSSARAFRGPRPATKGTTWARHGRVAAALMSTPTWLTTVTRVCSTSRCTSSCARAFCSGCSSSAATSRPGPQREASTGRGSSRLRPKATARRTLGGWSPISSLAAALSAHTPATFSLWYCTEMSPVSCAVMTLAWESRMESRMASRSALSCLASRPPPPTATT
mmetsp:Transcript_11957/g.35805  ORF Transcript_11957/g.35805 Transcript_11957/m.35805 type:complete len:209 (+) Transcript_11957:1751-2377(+)